MRAAAVLDRFGAQRVLAGALEEAFASRSIELELLSHRALVAGVSIVQDGRERPRVEPDRPLLWLSAADPSPDLTPDDRFLHSEVVAASRSIAMLSRSPVVNRPTPFSPCGRFPGSAVMGVRRVAGLPGLDVAVRSERFTAMQVGEVGSAGEGPVASGAELYDYATGRSAYGVADRVPGPVRTRRSLPSARLVRVRVAGRGVLAPGSVPRWFETASLDVARSYELQLATVWWLVDEAGRGTLARVDCWTWDRSLDGDAHLIADALAVWLLDEARAPAPGLPGLDAEVAVP